MVRQDSSQSEMSEKGSGASEQEVSDTQGEGSRSKDPEVEDDRTRTKMLYEVLHGFAGDLVEMLNVQVSVWSSNMYIRDDVASVWSV